MKKMIMPVLFAMIFIAFVIVYALFILVAPAPLIWKILIGGLLLATAPVMVYVLIQRYRELKEEEKDDLSKY